MRKKLWEFGFAGTRHISNMPLSFPFENTMLKIMAFPNC